MLKKNIKQDGFKDCGPCCLLMIIMHYKGYYNIEQLKEMCKTDKNGTTAYHLIEAAKKCGFESEAIRIKLEDMQNIILPCIAHVTLDKSYNHYVVIEKIDFKNKKLLVNDPIGKTNYYKFDKFNSIFNNVVITLFPIKKIQFNHKNSILEFFLELIKTSTNQIIETFIISLFITIFSIITSFYMQNMLDNFYSKRTIILTFLIFLLVYLLKIISDYLRNKLLIIINQKIDFNLTYNTFKQIIKLPYYYYRNNTTGEIISKINDLDIVRQVFSKTIISFIDLPLAIICLIVMYFISPILFSIGLVILLLYVLCVLLFRKIFSNHILECTSKKAETTSYMVETINGFETVKGCNKEDKTIDKFENKYINLLNNLYYFDNCYNHQYLIKEIIDNIGFLVIILVGVFLKLDDKITIGKLLSFNSLLVYFLEPIKNIINLDSYIAKAKIAIDKILKLFYIKKENSIIDIPMCGDIEFKNLNYTFDDVNMVLKNINLKIKQGSKVMIVGKSGSGKSTLFKILKKYYNVSRGQAFVNNIDINDYSKSDIIYISQDEILFTDTLYNNIDSNNIIDISKICLLDDIVNRSNVGYNMLIEENGFNLSGGEKQRIVLARAIANDFNILVIDEGLNQVDVKMEKIILENLFKKYKEKTIIFISHRLDNKNLFDDVIKIENGELNGCV